MQRRKLLRNKEELVFEEVLTNNFLDYLIILDISLNSSVPA